MGVSFASYEIARSGLMVNERALTVTGHNISNVNTTGYVRQQAMITTGPYQAMEHRTGMFQLGLGADIQQIRQIRHTFLDNIYRQESTTYGYWEAKSKTIQDVQAALGEPMGAGLQNVMNQFWDSWQELSKAPESLTVRALVRQRGEAFVHHVNHLGSQLDKLQEDLNSEIQVRIDEINQITEGIAALNVEILKTEISRDTASDYRDQRNTMVDRLSKLVNAEVTEMQDGQLAVTLGGYFLVTKGVHTKLYADESQTGGKFLVPKIEGTDIEVPIKSGTLKGLMESRGEVFGATGSIENGTPNTKADISFAIDISDGSAANLTNIRASIDSYVAELKNKGIDYNLRLITFKDGVAYNHNFGADDDGFIAAVNDPAIVTEDGADDENDFSSVINALEGITDFRQGANRYAVVFTGESIGGNGGVAVTDTDIDSFADRLNTIGVKTSVVSPNASAGDPAGEPGWASLTEQTYGEAYDIAAFTADISGFMKSMANDTNDDVNQGISTIEQSTNVISNLKKQLNALINIMVREINSIHSSGKTLTGDDGGNFFAAIDNAYPLEMGNIKLDDSLSSSLSLNNIVASASGANGDNSLALEIANLRHESLLGKIGETISIDDFYRGIILDVGNNGNDAMRISENQQKLVQSADNYRQSITGVSMDEEMNNMMKYKFAYNASSRIINVVDEMLETIITRMGLAGR